MKVTCGDCDGTGRFVVQYCNPPPNEEVDCDSCDGSGERDLVEASVLTIAAEPLVASRNAVVIQRYEVLYVDRTGCRIGLEPHGDDRLVTINGAPATVIKLLRASDGETREYLRNFAAFVNRTLEREVLEVVADGNRLKIQEAARG